MRSPLAENRPPWLDALAAGALALLLAGFGALVEGVGERELILIVGSVFALAALPGWIVLHRRIRLIADIPLQKAGSAAQGRIAINGRAKALAGVQPLNPLNGLPCLWYHVSVTRGKGENQEHYEYGSDESFLIADDSGECLIEPTGAQVLAAQSETVIRDDERIVHSMILAGETLFVIGQFRALASDALRSEEELARELIADWKQDPESLRKRFDLDRSGEIDTREWTLARAAARREARQRRLDAAGEATLHAIGADRAGMLISAQPRPRLLRRLRLWRAFATFAFLCGSALIGKALTLR
ncbi:hypothetical protein [Niveibacterium terrae]|uniref:hypothetical protein n=1 Tax=Niveibacterium terrae TaxID=3373598 RepID=UPI003A921430